ncbi:TIGR03084 family metal-binding protein [Nocardioides sp. Root151]|uniref:TIGR03084 family metal-binding protein n=1 Tax=Nocardioides sp. Root151 TaxID=1736475 RepID=UPI0007036B75|nr:TIGR03084 family metal-binding protein [Nocardioides sp. Root151]KQZ75998.1 wyosine base formation domain-containing protein [Nocardioides sp. Root151]
MSDVLDGVLADLEAQSAELDDHVAGLTDEQWRMPTPAAGWDVATQISHLAWTDEASVAAATDKARWDELVLEAIADPQNVVDSAALDGAKVPPSELLGRWRAGRAALGAALRSVPEGEKIPWYGPPMSPTSMATARFMETWAHSLDVYDALISIGSITGQPEPTDRIVHVAHIGVRTRNFSFAANDLTPPSEEFRVELTSPSGQSWTYGPAEAAQRVTGSAIDFCLLVTQRVNRADTDLVATGTDADQWLDVAQCFAGQPGEGRKAR